MLRAARVHTARLKVANVNLGNTSRVLQPARTLRQRDGLQAIDGCRAENCAFAACDGRHDASRERTREEKGGVQIDAPSPLAMVDMTSAGEVTTFSVTPRILMFPDCAKAQGNPHQKHTTNKRVRIHMHPRSSNATARTERPIRGCQAPKPLPYVAEVPPGSGNMDPSVPNRALGSRHLVHPQLQARPRVVEQVAGGCACT